MIMEESMDEKIRTQAHDNST